MPVEKITFGCRVLTPLFLAGADGTERDAVPELRPPSLKGAMGFWWRAVQAEEDPERLKRSKPESSAAPTKERGKASSGLG